MGGEFNASRSNFLVYIPCVGSRAVMLLGDDLAFSSNPDWHFRSADNSGHDSARRASAFTEDGNAAVHKFLSRLRR